MTKKADFNAEEWSTVVEAPVLAGLRVIAADRGGTIRESLALGQVYAQARKGHGESELLDELASSPPALDQERLRAAGDVGQAMAERLREALAILEQKASPEEVEAYRRFVMNAGRDGRQGPQGGRLHRHRRQAGEREQQAALEEIAAALGIAAGADS